MWGSAEKTGKSWNNGAQLPKLESRFGTPEHTSTNKNGVATVSSQGASFGKLAIRDPDLMVVVKNWRGLPEPVRVGVLTMVRGALKGQ